MLIHPILQNLDRTTHERKAVLKKHGLTKPQESTIEQLWTIQANYDDYFKHCNLLKGETVIAFCSPITSAVLNLKESSVITDVAFSVFEKGL